jgi:hypothetical protein
MVGTFLQKRAARLFLSLFFITIGPVLFVVRPRNGLVDPETTIRE